MGVNYNPGIVTNGLVLCLDAANKKSYSGSGNTWIDLSGNGNTGTLINNPTFNSSNNTITLNGTSQYITGNCGPSFTNGAAYTSILWFKLATISGEQHLIELQGGQNNGVQFYSYGGVGTLNTNNYGNLTGGPAIVPGTWNMAVQAKDASGNAAMYLNGVLIASGTLPTYGLATKYYIGEFVGGGSYYLNGQISIAQMYNRMLSASEISQNFNAIRGRYGI